MNSTRRYTLLTSLMALMAILNAEAQTSPEVPRLVVNIIVDQLRSDYLEAFSPLYGDEGFNRLMTEGRFYSRAEYPYSRPDRASAIASLMTGATPYEHGVVAQQWLNRSTLQPVFCVDDSKVDGLFTTEKSSPAALGVSTISDELKVSTEGKALVYALAPFRDAAILSAGHAADGAFWINDQTGQWCSTSYYGTYPAWAQLYEDGQSLRSRIKNILWEPSSGLVGNFNYFVSGGTRTPFKHKYTGDNKFVDFKASALVNEEVNRFARQCLLTTDVGADAVTDFLSLTYYAGNYQHKGVDVCPIEMQDTYVRLDHCLAELMKFVEDKVGRNRVLYVLTSTGCSDLEAEDVSRYRIPTGNFSITRAQLLLNMYLVAVYGQGQYVETAMDNQIYLNLKLIENRALNLTEVLERCQDFLMQLDGVRDVFTSQRLSLGGGSPVISKMRNAYNPRCSGDIMIQVAPGWHIVNENTHTDRLVRESYMGFPLIFYGCNVERETITTPVTVDHLAPTLARCLRIRAPNACSVAPL